MGILGEPISLCESHMHEEEKRVKEKKNYVKGITGKKGKMRLIFWELHLPSFPTPFPCADAFVFVLFGFSQHHLYIYTCVLQDGFSLIDYENECLYFSFQE